MAKLAISPSEASFTALGSITREPQKLLVPQSHFTYFTSKTREVYTPETSCMKNMWRVKQLRLSGWESISGPSRNGPLISSDINSITVEWSNVKTIMNSRSIMPGDIWDSFMSTLARRRPSSFYKLQKGAEKIPYDIGIEKACRGCNEKRLSINETREIFKRVS